MADLGTLISKVNPKLYISQSQNLITGQVLDELSQPVSTMVFAINRIDGRYIDNTRQPTDSLGNFIIRLPIGITYTEVQVICIGADTTLKNDLIYRVLI